MMFAFPKLGNAQDISLVGGADPIWKGTQPNAGAGFWLDQGPVGSGDTRRDLIIGAPGNASIPGAVFILFGGPRRTGEILLSEAQVIITSSEAGNRFGASTAAGNILSLDGPTPHNLLIGAPGALGNRGAVYLMAAGFASGTSTTEASATLRILGAAGDQLGTAVAASDLNADGYSEIILGAPGNGRIYVLPGGPGMSGTIDLSVTPALRTYSATGLGSALTSGDVTGDSIADVIAGAPSQNRTYVFAGGEAIPTTAFATFTGIDAGDEAGKTVRIVDLDGDGQRDLVIAAPGGDGPFNDRTDAGEAYVVWGPVTAGAHTLSSAGVVFFGGAPSMRLGDGSTARDITAGQPGELVLLASGGAGGAGQLEIYYGRARATIGVLQADQRRFVDFADAGQASRKIYGDPAAGPITSAQVFGVTNGSSRDIIVGVAAADSGAGRVYFVISPDVRMVLETPVHGYEVATTFTVSGWALDVAAASGTGVSEVVVYAYPNPGSGQTGTALGAATYGGARSDVAATYSTQFTNSGFTKQVTTLTPGVYQISVFAKSTVSNQFMLSKSVVIVVVSGTPSPNPVTVPGVIDPGSTPTTTLPGYDPNGPNPNTRVAVNRTSMSFGAVAGPNGLRSGPQHATVTFSNGISTWTATTDAPWLQITGGSGNGAASFNLTVKEGTYGVSTQTGTVTITAVNVPNSPISFPVTLRVVETPVQPVGVMDTPANNITGVTGAIAVTGWVSDDIDIQEVGIYRDPMSYESPNHPTGKMFVGRATFVEGARPDIDAIFEQPFDYEAGWGYMLLTNMLPFQGNGTFTLHAYATDTDGHTVLLGSRTITCDNANATKPFGAIDTPDQGGTASGTAYVNFGWALTPLPHSIPTDGSSILVYIDGVSVGRPTYNNYRADVATLFPGYANTDGAIGYYQFDTTTLANGVHTIAWAVRDTAGREDGIGSRYFTVLNGSVFSTVTLEASTSIEEMSGRGAETRVSAGVGASSGLDAATLATVPVSTVPVYRRDGYDQNAPLHLTQADELGVVRLTADAVGRFALTLSAPVKDENGGYEGYMVAGGKLQALPTGSFLDKKSGDFYWQPGVGFNGTYQLVFIRTEGGGRVRIPVEVTIGQRPAAPTNVRIVK